MLAFLIALVSVPVLLSFALADDLLDAVFRSVIGIAGLAALLAAVTVADIAQDVQPPSAAFIHLANR